MNQVLANMTVVIVANDINLSIFKPKWLCNTGIFSEEELQGNIIITPVAVQIPTPRFSFNVFPNRMQMSFLSNIDNTQSEIERVLVKAVETLPHTPFTAIGLNFDYLVAPDDITEYITWEHKLFSSTFANNLSFPNGANSRFGSYVSYNVMGFRLKINATPNIAQDNIKLLGDSWEGHNEILALKFNFHASVKNSDNPAKSVIENLLKWNEASQLSQKLIGQFSD